MVVGAKGAAQQESPAGAEASTTKNPAAGSAAQAAVPRLVRFSGVLKDAAGKPTHGVEDVTFSLYGIEAGGEPLWFETQTVEADALGRYTVLLGAMHPDGLPIDLFASGEARWLGVSVGKLPEQPRVLLVAVPYALKAADADTLGGKPVTAFVATDQLKDQVRSELSSQVSSGKLGGRTFNALIGTTTPSPQAALTSPTSAAPAITTSGQSSFACSTTTPCVTVSQSSTGIGTQSAAKTLGLYGLATQTTGTTYGVRGQTASTTGRGILGYATATTGGTIGVYGLVPSTSGIGVLGEATAASGATRGLIGRAASTTGIGVWGYATNTSGSTTGVRGDVWSPNGIAGIFNTVNPTGKILVGRFNNSDKFSVDGSGNVTAAGSVAATAFVGNSVVVVGNQSITGLLAASGTTTALGSAVLYATQSGSTTTPPVDVSTLLPSAIVGSATATTGFASGVSGSTASPDGFGVLGAALNSGGSGVGVAGVTTSTGGESAGVIAGSLATTGNAGALYATVSSTTGVAGTFDSTIAGAKLIKGTVGLDTKTEVFNVKTNGDVTTGPGDFRALGPGKGLILKSPDGVTCARISIDNAGAVVTSVVSCP
jgi:hypothetical protein